METFLRAMGKGQYLSVGFMHIMSLVLPMITGRELQRIN